MRSNYKTLGHYIKEIDSRDTHREISTLLGVSIEKKFIRSIANTIGTDMRTYKRVKRNQFAYGPVTSRNGDKISIAQLEDYDEAIVSQAYITFDVTKKEDLLPEYLMMWFRRPEFDRYARFMSHGSAREIFSWVEMCNTKLPIPSPAKQREVVAEYNTIQNRIKLNQQIIQKLEETAQAIYKQWFVDFEFPDEEGKPYKRGGGEMIQSELGEIPKGWHVRSLKALCRVKGGKRLPKGSDLNNHKQGRIYITVSDMQPTKWLVANEYFQYVDNHTQEKIARYTVSSGDLLLSIVGTIGVVSIVDDSLNSANLTENCVKLTEFTNITADFLYHFLRSNAGKREIESRTVGGVQGKLPLYNIHSIPVLVPKNRVINAYDQVMNTINKPMLGFHKERYLLEALSALLLSKLATIEG